MREQRSEGLQHHKRGSSDSSEAAVRSGLRVRIRRIPTSPAVAVRVWLRAGALREPMPGLALVTGRSLVEGSSSRDWREIAEAAEVRGASLTSFGGYAICGVSIDTLAADWELALEWCAELVLEPTFPLDRCRLLTRQAATEIDAISDHADIATGFAFLRQLYGEHPFGRPLQGTVEALSQIASEQCHRFHQESLAQGIIIGVAGNIDESSTSARVASLFGRVGDKAKRTSLPPIAPAPAGTGRQEVVTSATDQAHLYAGHLTVRMQDPDYAALQIASIIFGSGPGLAGRIPLRIRDREGLAYTAHADLVAGAGLERGRLVLYAATAPGNVARVESAMREETRRLLEEGVTETEVKEAKSYLLGREPFRRETARQWAELMAEAELLGLPIDDSTWIRQLWHSVDRQQVEAALQRALHPDDLRVTVGLPHRAS